MKLSNNSLIIIFIINGIFQLLFINKAVAQNNFYYIRYDATQGNGTTLVEYLDTNLNFGTSSNIIYFSDGTNPVLCTTARQWNELRSTMLNMQNSSDFDQQFDFDSICDIFSTIFDEYVMQNEEGLHLRGKKDYQWTCTFLIPYSDTENRYVINMLKQIITINDLNSRDVNTRIIAYNIHSTKKIQP